MRVHKLVVQVEETEKAFFEAVGATTMTSSDVRFLRETFNGQSV